MCQISIYAPIGEAADTPAALQISVTVNALMQKGVDVRLLHFADAPDAYTDDRRVEEVLMRDGPDVFPITVVDDEVFLKKEYPHYGDLLAWSAKAPID
jgi:hypothetical protein